jgi:4-hydroxy-4-methyl-2-oxoglutarate aldolase
MGSRPLLTEEELTALRQFDTGRIAKAIEKFNIRLRNTGFTDGNIRCMFPDAPSMVGYAVGGRLRSDDPPIAGSLFRDRGGRWTRILETQAPRIPVLEDVDEKPGRGAFVGDMPAAILRALGCVGYVTNAAVREWPSVRRIGVPLFAGSVAVSHAYAHIFDIRMPVNVEGMEVHNGALLHGDQHGMLTPPVEIAAEIPNVRAKLPGSEQEVIEFCRSKGFPVEKFGGLNALVQAGSAGVRNPLFERDW